MVISGGGLSCAWKQDCTLSREGCRGHCWHRGPCRQRGGSGQKVDRWEGASVGAQEPGDCRGQVGRRGTGRKETGQGGQGCPAGTWRCVEPWCALCRRGWHVATVALAPGSAQVLWSLLFACLESALFPSSVPSRLAGRRGRPVLTPGEHVPCRNPPG